MERLRPAEIIYPTQAQAMKALLQNQRAILSAYDDWVFALETALFTVREHFKVAGLDGFGLKDRTAAVGAAGGVLHYLTQHLRRDAANLTRISFYQRNDFLALDFTTLRHLEILEPLHHDAPKTACLFGAMNRTVTPMGARRLRNWLSQPLAAVGPIQRRQQAIQTFLENALSLEHFRAQLTHVRDLERTIGRLSAGNGNARDLMALRMALEQIPALKNVLLEIRKTTPSSHHQLRDLPELDSRSENHTGEASVPLLHELESQLAELPELVDLLKRAILDEPPLAIKEGGLIRDGFDPALDELRTAMRGGKDWIAKLQQDEITRTGTKNLGRAFVFAKPPRRKPIDEFRARSSTVNSGTRRASYRRRACAETLG